MALCLALLVHSWFTVIAWIDHGYTGFFPPFTATNTTQIFSDLVIALSLVHLWIFHDVRARGYGMQWFVLTLMCTALAGSYGPLGCLLMRDTRWFGINRGMTP